MTEKFLLSKQMSGNATYRALRQQTQPLVCFVLPCALLRKSDRRILRREFGLALNPLQAREYIPR